MPYLLETDLTCSLSCDWKISYTGKLITTFRYLTLFITFIVAVVIRNYVLERRCLLLKWPARRPGLEKILWSRLNFSLSEFLMFENFSQKHSELEIIIWVNDQNEWFSDWWLPRWRIDCYVNIFSGRINDQGWLIVAVYFIKQSTFYCFLTSISRIKTGYINPYYISSV